MAKNTSGIDSVIDWYTQKELEFSERGDFIQADRCMEHRVFYEDLKAKVERDTNERQCHTLSPQG
jgi:hypothetical protein